MHLLQKLTGMEWLQFGYSLGTRIVSNNDYRNDVIEIIEIDDDDT